MSDTRLLTKKEIDKVTSAFVREDTYYYEAANIQLCKAQRDLTAEIVRAEEGERLLSEVLSETFMDEGYVSVRFFQDTWEARKEGRMPE